MCHIRFARGRGLAWKFPRCWQVTSSWCLRQSWGRKQSQFSFIWVVSPCLFWMLQGYNSKNTCALGASRRYKSQGAICSFQASFPSGLTHLLAQSSAPFLCSYLAPSTSAIEFTGVPGCMQRQIPFLPNLHLLHMTPKSFTEGEGCK